MKSFKAISERIEKRKDVAKHKSRICAMSIGEDYDAKTLASMGRDD